MNPVLEALTPLVGLWIAEIRWSEETHKLIGGPRSVRTPVSFNWIEDGSFLVHRIGTDTSPTARWIIGADESSLDFAVLYSDDRQVSRLYNMSLREGVWKVYRKAPGFHQRFTGHFSADQKTIEARWEKSSDGTDWKLDFDITYTKAA